MCSSFSYIPGGILAAASQEEETPGALGNLNEAEDSDLGTESGMEPGFPQCPPAVPWGFLPEPSSCIPQTCELFSWPCCPAFCTQNPLEHHTEEDLFKVDNLVVGFFWHQG